MCKEYGIHGLDHAVEYLCKDALRINYMTITNIVHNQLCVNNINVQQLMGSSIDVLKLISSLTLFSEAITKIQQDSSLPEDTLVEVSAFKSEKVEVILEKLDKRCQFTLDNLS